MAQTTVDAPDPAKGKSWAKVFDRTEIPIAVYAAIFVTMALLWVFQNIHPDVTLGFFTELMGAAFTLFIIDTLLVRSKTKRWKVVQSHVDDLIARDVNRLRDGLAVRAFGFDPVISGEVPTADQVASVRSQRAELLVEMEGREVEDLAASLALPSLFSEQTHAYLSQKADDLWDLFNMRYSEYLAPELVSVLIRLHTHVKDLCGHLRQYARAERFQDDAAYYHAIGVKGATVSIKEILAIVNELKRQGYSVPARLDIGPEG